MGFNLTSVTDAIGGVIESVGGVLPGVVQTVETLRGGGGGGGGGGVMPGGAPISVAPVEYAPAPPSWTPAPAAPASITEYGVQTPSETRLMAAISAPFTGMNGAVARTPSPRTFALPNPATNRLTWFKPAGTPLLWSGDLTACGRVKRLARKAKRAGGR